MIPFRRLEPLLPGVLLLVLFRDNLPEQTQLIVGNLGRPPDAAEPELHLPDRPTSQPICRMYWPELSFRSVLPVVRAIVPRRSTGGWKGP